jgi:hypothetical protein
MDDVIDTGHEHSDVSESTRTRSKNNYRKIMYLVILAYRHQVAENRFVLTVVLVTVR